MSYRKQPIEEDSQINCPDKIRDDIVRGAKAITLHNSACLASSAVGSKSEKLIQMSLARDPAQYTHQEYF